MHLNFGAVSTDHCAGTPCNSKIANAVKPTDIHIQWLALVIDPRAAVRHEPLSNG